MTLTRFLITLCVVCMYCVPNLALAKPGNQGARGLNAEAMEELITAGVDKYMGKFDPMQSESLGDGWVKHTFDTEGGDGPTCIAGTPFSAFTKAGNPAKLMIFLQGGGACWQDFYNCNLFSDELPPPLAYPASGIWVDEFETETQTLSNPLADWSVVYAPYCDGSIWIGDNEVEDPVFNLYLGSNRHHRGLRNLTATVDLARSSFPNAGRILIAGSSAGGFGASTFAPFLARFAWGNTEKIMVFNDAGPMLFNPDELDAIQTRADDWQFGQFFPESCSECSDTTQLIELVKWRLSNDTTVREALYTTDGDYTIRWFNNIGTQEEYRNRILTEHDPVNDAFPNRYKRFIRSGDGGHTALQGPTFYLNEVDGIPLDVWTADFLVPRPFWVDLVEDYIPLPE